MAVTIWLTTTTKHAENRTVWSSEYSDEIKNRQSRTVDVYLVVRGTIPKGSTFVLSWVVLVPSVHNIYHMYEWYPVMQVVVTHDYDVASRVFRLARDTGTVFVLPLLVKWKANLQKKTNPPKENRIPYRFHVGIVPKIGKAKRKLIPQKKTNPQFICRRR